MEGLQNSMVLLALAEQDLKPMANELRELEERFEAMKERVRLQHLLVQDLRREVRAKKDALVAAEEDPAIRRAEKAAEAKKRRYEECLQALSACEGDEWFVKRREATWAGVDADVAVAELKKLKEKKEKK